MRLRASLAAALTGMLMLGAQPLHADDAKLIDANARAALQALYDSTPAAKALGEKAVAILVFPSVTKGGLGLGAQFGEGALIMQGRTMGYYSTTGASLGLQAGLQTYRYAMFFMSDKALHEFRNANGFEVGVGPNIVIMDDGAAKNLTTATAKADIYAFIFGQKGLMAGIGILGSKISRIDK